MPIQFYKPNSSTKGFACSFNYSEKDNTVYAQLIKQVGWDDTNKKGSFKGGEKTSIKLGEVEIGGILDSIEQNRGEKGFSIFHTTDKSSKSISFKPYLRENIQVGHSFSITETNKETNAKNSAYIGFNFAEARLLKEYLIYCLQRTFSEPDLKDQVNNILKLTKNSLNNQNKEPSEVI